MINPELKPYLDMWAKAWAGVPPDAPPAARRALLEKLSDQSRRPLPPGVASTVMTLPGDRPVRMRIFRPTSGVPTPALIYMHGGGWSQGSPETHDEITAGLADACKTAVFSVDYALAPERPFPAAVDDCRAVVEWLFANAALENVRPDAISVGGDSAGANLAAAMTLVFRGTPHRLRGQLLFYPAVDFTHSRPSFTENADGPIINTKSMPAVMTLYLPNVADRTNPLAAPIRASSHRGLPPAFIAVAEHDPLRDDGIAYAETLEAAAVPVALHRGAGLFHGYLRALSWAACVRTAFGEACRWFDELNAAAAKKTAVGT